MTDKKIRYLAKTAASIVVGLVCIWAFDATLMESFIASLCSRSVMEIEE